MSESSFFDKLAALRHASCDQIPTPQLAVLTRATARLRRSGILQKSLQPGETAPNFQFIDHDNNQCSLYSLLETGPVVLNFFRGFWCRFCQTELEALQLIRSELERTGCHYLAISPQQPESVANEFDRVQFVYDKHNQIARSFNIAYDLGKDEVELLSEWKIDLANTSENGNWSLPVPATYVIAQDKTVAFQFADVDFRTRCCPDELVDELKRLAQR